MLVAIALGSLAAAFLHETADKSRRRRRAARALAVDAALWETVDELPCGSGAPAARAEAAGAQGEQRIAQATADARVNAAVKRAAMAEAAAALAQEEAAEAAAVAASYREAYEAAHSPDTPERATPPQQNASLPAHHLGAAAPPSPPVDANVADVEVDAKSVSGSDTDWDRSFFLASQQRSCAACGRMARERAALVPCGHIACAACAGDCQACFTCGAAVTHVLRLRE